jgi:hypothetical protein
VDFKIPLSPALQRANSYLYLTNKFYVNNKPIQ